MNIKARKLITSDVFAFSRLIKKAGIKKEVSAFAAKATQENKNLNVDEVGLEFILLLMESACDIEHELYSFIGSICSVDGSVIENLELDELRDVFKAIAAVNNLESFFTKVFSSQT